MSEDRPAEWLSAYRTASATGVTARTLRNWESKGIITSRRSPTGQRIYNLSSLPPGFSTIKPDEQQQSSSSGERFIYARVSSSKQREDLERQVSCLQQQFPQHKVIRDIGSGINFKRPGLRTLVRCSLRGTLQEVVVAHRDRLTRLGFDLLEYLFAQSGAQLVVVGGGEKLCTEAELGEDLLSIVHIFSSRAYGMRKYKSDKPVSRPGGRRERAKKAQESTEARQGGEGTTQEASQESSSAAAGGTVDEMQKD